MDDLLGAPDSATDYDSHRPLVSVIVPFYNVQAYIAECISSVLTQDHRNIELLLIDDASTDSSRAIADRYAKQDPRVRIITHNKNLGLGPARNTGARNASGSYFFFLDSDDYLASSSALRALVNSAQNNGHDVLIASCVSLTDDGKIIDHEKGHACGKIKAQGTDIGGMDAFLAVMGQSPKYYLPMRAWGTLIERNFYSALSLDYPPFEHEDIPHTPFMYASAKSLAFSEEVAVVYRTREGSISRTPWNARRIQRYRQMWNVFRENTQRFSLQDGLALSTIEMAGHMIWRMETNSFDSDGLAEAVSLLEEMMRDAARTRDLDKLWNFLDWTNRSLATWSGSHRSFAQIIAALPANLTVKYYERRLGVT
jgi:glycosyltransferase involved in cell wall biosynthesis